MSQIKSLNLKSYGQPCFPKCHKMTQLKIWCKMTAQKMQIRHNIFHLKLLLSWNSTYVTKKRVWQVTTIIQLALCHLVTSHFQEIACNYTPKGQIRWPIFLLLLCMIVLTKITSKFPKPIIFRILVFSCHKMTLITIITRMPHLLKQISFRCQHPVSTPSVNTGCQHLP